MECKTSNFQNSDFFSTKDLMKVKADSEEKPNPRNNQFYEESDWIEFTVQQNNKPIKLKTYRTCPDKNNPKECKAILVLFHGLGNHLNNSAHVAKYLSQQGITTLGFDFRGFGQSEGEKGIVESEEQHIDDCTKFIEKVEQYYDGQKVFIGGQSMGGLTCYLLGMKFPDRFRGSILFAPSIKDISDHQSIGKKFLKLANCLIPNFKIVSISEKDDSKNLQVQKDLRNDPYVTHEKFKPKTVTFVVNKMQNIPETFKNYNAPFLIIQGKVDKLVNASQVKDLIDQSPSKDKSAWLYPKLWHNIWLEEEILDILPKLSEWILKRA